MHLQVLFEGGLVGVGLPTLVAEEHLLFGVDQFVSLEVTRPAEALAAVGAAVFLLSCVSS